MAEIIPGETGSLVRQPTPTPAQSSPAIPVSQPDLATTPSRSDQVADTIPQSPQESAPLSPSPSMVRNDSELQTRLAMVNDVYMQTYGAAVNPAVAYGLAKSDLSEQDIARLLSRSAPLFTSMGEGIHLAPNKPGADPDQPPPPPKPNDNWFSGINQLMHNLNLGVNPMKPSSAKTIIQQNQGAQSLEEVRALLTDKGFLAESVIPKDATGANLNKWDEATVRALLRYYDQNYTNLAQKQHELQQAGYGWDLKTDGVLTAEWAKEFGKQQQEKMQVDKVAEKLPAFVSVFYKMLPHDPEMRQFWFDIAGRNDHDNPVSAVAERILHGFGTGVQIMGSFFAPFIAVGEVNALRQVGDDPEYTKIMSRATNALGFDTKDTIGEILRGLPELAAPGGLVAMRNSGIASAAHASVGEAFARLVAQVQNNQTAMAALEEAGQYREKKVKEMAVDPHVIDVFGVIPKDLAQKDQTAQTAWTAVQLATDFLLYRKMGMSMSGDPMGRIPRGNVRYVIDNQDARSLSNAIAMAINERNWNTAIRLAGDSPQAKLFVSQLSSKIRTADRKTTAAAQQAAAAAGSTPPAFAISGARVLPSKVLDELARRYSTEGHNLNTRITKSATIQSFLDEHSDMWWARAASRVPSGKGPEYINPETNPRVYRDIADYAREVYQNPTMVNGVVSRMLSARTAGDLGKIVDDINHDIPNYYKTGPIEGAGKSRGYLGMANSPLGSHLMPRDIGGSTVMEEHAILPSEQRSLAFFHNLWDMQRRPIGDTGSLGSSLAKLEAVARNIESQYMHNAMTFSNKVAFYPRALMTSFSIPFATRLAVTGRARTWLFAGSNSNEAAEWEAAKANHNLIDSRNRFYRANAQHMEIDYGVNAGFIEKSQGARDMAKRDPALARDFWRRTTNDELARRWMQGATHTTAAGPFNNVWDVPAGDAEAAKWLSSSRGQRLSKELGFFDPQTGVVDTAAHVQALSRSLESYATNASDVMNAWAHGHTTENILRIADASPQDYFVTGLRRITNPEVGSNVLQRAIMAGWQGFDTRDIPKVGDFLGKFGVNWHVPGSGSVSAAERGIMYDRLAAKYFHQLNAEIPGIDSVKASQTAMQMALDHTNHYQLNLANMTMAERNLRWVSYFTTKKRLWFSLLGDEAWKNKGFGAGFKNIVSEFEKDNADQPDYLRYSIPVKVPFDFGGFKAGTEVRVPLDRMLWMAELPMFSSLVALPIGLLQGATGLDNDPSATPQQIGFSRFDSALQSIYAFARWKSDPDSYKQGLGDAYYQKLRADPNVRPEEMQRYLKLNPELERFYWQTNHEKLLAEARGEPALTARQAEDRVVFKHLTESGLTLIRPVSGTSIEPERLAFQKLMAQYEAIQDPGKREEFLRDHEDLRKWWFMGTDPDQHDQLIRGWQKYYVERGKMDQWGEQFYGAAGDPSAPNTAVLNRWEATKKEQEFRDKIDQIGREEPEWAKTFLQDERAGKIVQERQRAYDVLKAMFPNVKAQTDDLVPDAKRVAKIAELDNLRNAADLFKGTPAEGDFNAIMGKAAHLAGDLREFDAPAHNPNQAIIKDYIGNVYFPAMDKLGILFTYIDEAKKAKVPSGVMTQFYRQVQKIRDSLDGPFTIDGVKMPGVEAVQWGGWDPTVQHDHLVSWASLNPRQRTNFQNDLLARLGDDRLASLKQEARDAKRTGRKLLEEAGVIQ